MRMSIDEIIVKEQEISKIFQKTVNTHKVNEDLSLEELYCDDTEIIEEELKNCKELADFHNQIADTMRKYQKITEIVKSWRENGLDYDSCDAMDNIERVIEDGNDRGKRNQNS